MSCLRHNWEVGRHLCPVLRGSCGELLYDGAYLTKTPSGRLLDAQLNAPRVGQELGMLLIDFRAVMYSKNRPPNLGITWGTQKLKQPQPRFLAFG